MRARVLAAALCAGLLTLVRATPARAAADSVLVRVGGELAGRLYETINVPITVDLSGAPGRMLGSYRATLRFNPSQLQFQGTDNGGFAAPQVNTNHAADSGAVILAAIQPSGASGAVVIFYARFYVVSDTGQSPVTISFDEMSATATSVTPFESLVSLLRIVNGTFCKSLGRWGDVNGDGQANSLDALVALSTVVGIPVDTTAMNPALADVDGDGRVTSRDALIILSYAVGLPVTGYRVLLTAPGACGTGAAVTITISPDSLELQVGQSARVTFAARDSLGRNVSTDTGTVTSSNPSVAGWVSTESGELVQARAPGVATFTARLGPGVAATFKVVVLARRTTWYVDVQRASLAPTQTGSQALPFEFIGEALTLAHDGDTVLVASGTYEEVISQQVSVVLLGDSTARPVIDPRGSPYWSSDQSAVGLGSYTGRVVFAHFIVLAGTAYLDAHDLVVRGVRLDGANTGGGYSGMLRLVSENFTPAPAPLAGAGPMRTAGPLSLGSVLVDGVVVTADSTSSGIEVDQADSVEIRNSTVTRAAAGTDPGCGPTETSSSGILVVQASVSYVHDNVVTNPVCQGLGVFDAQNNPLVNDVGRATISRNHVTGAPYAGIVAGTRLVALDHNVIRNTGLVLGYRTYGYTAGVHVINVSGASPNSVVSVGDSIVNAGGRGFAVDTAAAASLDSLVVDGTGQDSSGSGTGVDLQAGGKFALSHSHISNALYADGVNFIGDQTVLRSHGNRIVGAGNNGISSVYNCDCAPPARPGPAVAGAPGPQKAGPYTGGPDTLISISDTILSSGQSGIFSRYGVYTLVDSAVVDSAGGQGIYLEYLGRATVSNSVARRAYDGIYSYEVDSLSVLRDTVDSNTYGMYLAYTVDSATIRGTVASMNATAGIYLEYSATARIDSTVFANNFYGLDLYNYAGARVRWSRFQANHVGLWMDLYASMPSRVDSSSFMFDSTGARNGASITDTLYAASNWWNDANGPACDSSVTGYVCPGGAAADTIYTMPGYGPIVFVPPLTSPAPAPVPPARPAFVALAGRVGGVRAARGPARPVQPPYGASGAAADQLRAGRPAAPAVAPAERPTHQWAPAWHAPSKARTHGVQVTRKRS